jgi:dissimilatory sulfite reductase (desulfoviridin) alpha/beta subunit
MAALTVSAEDEKRVKALGFLNNRGTDNFSGRVITVNGKITAEQLACIAEAARKFGNGNVTFTTRLTVEVQGIPYEKIEDFRTYIAQAGLVTGGTGAQVRPVVSCKGTTCKFGLLDSFGISEEIHHRFFEGYHEVKLPHKFKIAVGGCPNNCMKPNLNDVGIVGQRIPQLDSEKCKGCKKCGVEKVCPMGAASVVNGTMQINRDLCLNCGRCAGKCYFGALSNEEYGYKVYIGGRWGKKVSHGQPLGRIFTDKEEVLDIVEKAILLFREQGVTGERFSETISRIGFENVEAQLLGNELLERREEILAEK